MEPRTQPSPHSLPPPSLSLSPSCRDLSYNGLSGTIPSTIGKLTGLAYMYVVYRVLLRVLAADAWGGGGESERRAVWRWWQVGVAVRSAEREHAARCTPQDPSSREEEEEEEEEE